MACMYDEACMDDEDLELNLNLNKSRGTNHVPRTRIYCNGGHDMIIYDTSLPAVFMMS
jgi:hypothetical protein